MSLGTQLRENVRQIIQQGGKQVRFVYFNVQDNISEYDDSVDLMQSGNDLWTSGLVFPIKGTYGSTEATLLEQGKLLSNDTKLFILGDVNTSGTFRVGIGSPIISEYALIEDFVNAYEAGGDIVYKKLFLRRLPTGSLIGEG